MKTLTALMIATGMVATAIPAASAQDMMSQDNSMGQNGMASDSMMQPDAMGAPAPMPGNMTSSTPYNLGGATIEQIQSARSARIVHIADSARVAGHLPDNIGEIRTSLTHNPAMSGVFQPQNLSARDALGASVDQYGNLVIYVE